MANYIAKYAQAAIPRYTSYPPATQFHGGIGEADYRGWLEAIAPQDTLSLYVHIPFCQTLCWYCGCHTTVPNSQERANDYVRALKTEIARTGHCVTRKARVVHVHFGGGTPNYLSPAALAAVIEALGEHFSLSADTELSVEIDPRSLSREHISMLTQSGRLRVSLGVQDLSPDVQQLINRTQPFDLVRSVVGQLREAGVDGINIDLMYGLPGQSVDHVRRSASLSASLEPDRFAVFGYAHVPWFKKHQRAIDEAQLPTGEQRMGQADAAREALIEHGYEPIGLDHFARPSDPLCKAQREGRLRRNFQGYTTDPASALIGMGASSIGSFEEGYVQNEPHIGKYREAIERGALPIVRGVELDESDRRNRAVIERLMCDFEVDLQQLADSRSCSTRQFLRAISALEPLREDGLVDIDDLVVRATPAGRPYIRNVAACFDTFLGKSDQRFSRAV